MADCLPGVASCVAMTNVLWQQSLCRTPGSSLPHRGQFIRFSCSPPKVYSETFTRVQRLLDLRPALDLEQLVTLFGWVAQ